MFAAHCNDAEVAELLLRHGADPSIKDKFGKRAWERARAKSLQKLLSPAHDSRAGRRPAASFSAGQVKANSHNCTITTEIDSEISRKFETVSTKVKAEAKSEMEDSVRKKAMDFVAQLRSKIGEGDAIVRSQTHDNDGGEKEESQTNEHPNSGSKGEEPEENKHQQEALARYVDTKVEEAGERNLEECKRYVSQCLDARLEDLAKSLREEMNGELAKIWEVITAKVVGDESEPEKKPDLAPAGQKIGVRNVLHCRQPEEAEQLQSVTEGQRLRENPFVPLDSIPCDVVETGEQFAATEVEDPNKENTFAPEPETCTEEKAMDQEFGQKPELKQEQSEVQAKSRELVDIENRIKQRLARVQKGILASEAPMEA